MIDTMEIPVWILSGVCGSAGTFLFLVVFGLINRNDKSIKDIVKTEIAAVKDTIMRNEDKSDGADKEHSNNLSLIEDRTRNNDRELYQKIGAVYVILALIVGILIGSRFL